MKCQNCKFKPAKQGKFCWTCINLKRDPIKRAYQILKMNGKRRNKWHGLTLDHFIKVAVSNGYIEGKGIGKNDLTIDCKKNHLGYRNGNITVMIKSLNCSKGINPIDLPGIYMDAEVDF